MTTGIYKGFSTFNWGARKTFQLSDIELVKRDLLNHIYTVIGTRIMMPSFGTRIPTMTFEPCDETTRAIIETDLTTVFNYDPRVSIVNLNVVCIPDNSVILALADLLYVEFNVVDTLRIEVVSQ